MRFAPILLALTLVSLAGCLDGEDASENTMVEDSNPWLAREMSSDPVSSYLHDVSQPMEGFSMDLVTMTNYRTSVDLLVDLDSWVALPPGDGPFPLVLEITPYYGGGNPLDPLNALGGVGTWGATLLERGYAVGISSVRGTGNSGGCFSQGGDEEAEDSAAVIEHMASMPWSNGKVGVMGVSYPGTTPQDVWVEAPPALKTVIPISGISDLYKYNFVNGVPINVQGYGFNTYYWAMVGAAPAGLSGGVQVLGSPDHVATAIVGEACTDEVDVQYSGVTSTLDGNKDGYWQERDFYLEYLDEPDKERASVFYIHGLQDWNVKPHMMEDWLPMLQETGVPYKVWLGQWGHAWPGPASGCDTEGMACRADWWTQTMVAWFDQFLLDRETGILDAPPVQVQDDLGVWRHEAVWPPVDVRTETFALADGGALDAAATPGSATYTDMVLGSASLPGGVDRVQWVSDVFEADAHLSGLPHFSGVVTSSATRASLILTLQEQMADGSARSINFCAQSLNHVDNLGNGDLDISGKAQQVELDCFPQDDVIRQGSKLVLIASGQTVGGPAPGLLPQGLGGTITIEDAYLTIPIDDSIVVESPQPYESA